MENYNNQKKGKVVVGLALLGVGSLLLIREFGVEFPTWLISWPMLLIVIALVKGIKHGFRNSSWIIILLIGAIFLTEKIEPALSVAHYTWPAILIGIGIWFIFGKNRRSRFSFDKNESDNYYHPYTESVDDKKKVESEPTNSRSFGDETIDTVSVFGGTKKNILSKNFKGGDIVTIMGGTELNLSHADIQGTVVIDVVQIFGGTKIIIPHNWEVTTEMAAIFGGIEDKRTISPGAETNKILLIKGTSVFGGIEIKSF